MAEAYGGIIASAWRTHTVASVVSQTNTKATIRVQSYLQCVNNWTMSVTASALVNCDGQSTTGSGTGTTGTNGQFVVLSHDFTVDKSENARQVDCGSNITCTYNAGTSYASCYVEIAGITYSVPDAPTNVKWERSSETVMKGSWTNKPDNANLKAYKQISLDRIEFLGKATSSQWKNIGVLSGTSTTFSASGLKSNACYMFSINSRNNAGDSSHVNSAYMYTTPAAPSIAVEKTAETSVKVTVTATNCACVTGSHASAKAVAVIERQTGDGDWTALTSVAFANGIATYTDDATAGMYTYRAAVSVPSNTSNSSTLISEYATSETLVTICAPNAPLITSPASVVETSITQTITWIKNHPDGSAQSAAQVEITDTTGTAETSNIAGATSSLTWTPTVDGTYTVRVRTKGLHAEWGAWSDYLTVRAAAKPVVTITAPTVNTSDLPLTVKWAVADVTGVASQRVWLSNSGQTIDATVDKNTRTVTFDALENNSDWLINIQATNGAGLTSLVTKKITIEYVPPAPADVTVTADSDNARTVVNINTHSQQITFVATVPDLPAGAQLFCYGEWAEPVWSPSSRATLVKQEDGTYKGSVDVTVADGEKVKARLIYSFNGKNTWEKEENQCSITIQRSSVYHLTWDDASVMSEPGTTAVTIYRENSDGTRKLIGDSLGDNVQAVDNLPPLNVPVTYELVHTAASGAQTIEERTVTINCAGGMFNFGRSLTPLKIEYDYEQSTDWQQSTEEYHFATDNPLPYSYSLNELDQTGSVSGTFLWNAETYQKLREICETEAYVYFRDPFGSSSYNKFKPSLKITGDGSKHLQFSMSLTRLAWQEPGAQGAVA